MFAAIMLAVLMAHTGVEGSKARPQEAMPQAPTAPHRKEGVDISRLIDDIRAAVATRMPTLTLLRSHEQSGGARPHSFVLEWSPATPARGSRLRAYCAEYSSGEEAIRSVRLLRSTLSVGPPQPLPGVADEAYYLNYNHLWNTYFAHRQFVCQVGGPGEDATRSLTEIIVKNIEGVSATATVPRQTLSRPQDKPEPAWPPAGVFRAGGNVTLPKLIKETRPHHTADSIRAKIQGAVAMEVVVMTDGTVGEVRVIRSLDKKHGLDDECVRTVKEWQFTPGKRDSVAVPVIVEVTMTFVLANEPQTGGWVGLRPKIRRHRPPH